MAGEDPIGVMMRDILAFDHAVRQPSNSIPLVGAAMMESRAWTGVEGHHVLRFRLPECGFVPNLKLGFVVSTHFARSNFHGSCLEL
jgi:hypothetical protein